ncbi:MAG: hypothetical protein JWM34_3880 [Ilumatobacteraceae bacterium]|nr:hypothetical protein [Ilumatobacteraceae bacterium]
MAWDPPPSPLPPPVGPAAGAVPAFDDAAFTAALTAFSAPLGFVAGDAPSTTTVHRHDVVHPGGISMRCTVLGEGSSAGDAVLGVAQLAFFAIGVAIDVMAHSAGPHLDGRNHFSGSGRVRALETMLRMETKGRPVTDLGHRAAWTMDDPTTTSLGVLKHDRLLLITIRSGADRADQYAWLHACAVAVLPTV